MNNKRLDEIYKQILSYLEDPSFYEKYEHYLDKFKKYLQLKNDGKLTNIFNSEYLKFIRKEAPDIENSVKGIFDLVINIHLEKKQLINYLAYEAILFERDKYYAKSTMCKTCKKIRLNAFAKYERMKSLLC